MMDEFRQIFLIRYLYKIVAKRIASRLKKVIVNIASKTQIRFVLGKYILDGVLVTNEMIDFDKREKKGLHDV